MTFYDILKDEILFERLCWLIVICGIFCVCITEAIFKRKKP
jgi:hypothetical protein